MKFEVPSWDDVYKMCLRLADEVRRSKFAPDIIVGVARGGWIPARLMSDFLQNSNVANVRVEFYEDVGKTRKKPSITQPVSTPVKGRKVLVVDDVSDTGESLKLVCEDLKVKKPDFYIKETEAWIVYPHELFEFTKSMVKKFRGEGKSTDELKHDLAKIGLNSQIVDKFVDMLWTGCK